MTNNHPINVDFEAPEPLKRQGSLRRVLPPNTNGEPVVGIAAKMIERPRLSIPNSNNFNQNYIPYLQEYSLIAEYNMLVNHRLPGLYVVPSDNSALMWFCVVFVRKGLYQGGIFRFKLLIPEEFPNCSCPRVIFETKVFHPSVDPDSGEIEFKSVFPEWRKDVNRLWQMLEHVLQMFCSINTKNALNTEAAELFERSQEEFIKRVNESVHSSQVIVYNPPLVDDDHYIKFNHYDNEVHGRVFSALIDLKVSSESTATPGLSWVQYGSLEPFSTTHSC